jgi:hypothetical protein
MGQRARSIGAWGRKKEKAGIVKIQLRLPENSAGRTITNPFLYIWGSVKIKA